MLYIKPITSNILRVSFYYLRYSVFVSVLYVGYSMFMSDLLDVLWILDML